MSWFDFLFEASEAGKASDSFSSRTRVGSAQSVRQCVLPADAQHAALSYRLKRSKRQSVGLKIDADGLTVTAPTRLALRVIEDVVRTKRAWIERKLAEQQERLRRTPALRLVHDAAIPYRGGLCRLDLRSHPARSFWDREDGEPIVRLSPKDARSPQSIRAAFERLWKARALEVFEERLAAFVPRLQTHPLRLTVSSALTRWGSCSWSGSVRLSWRLLALDDELIDYVLAHELAHLVHMNHSSDFWREVQRLCPDYSVRRDRLKRYSIAALSFYDADPSDFR